MKKIIAAAVASAFVMPVMADVSISGSLSQFMVKQEEGGVSNTRLMGENSLSFKASAEGNNGLTVSGAFNISGSKTNDNAIHHDGGDGVTVAHPSIGAVMIGNPGSAIDSVDDATEIFEIVDPQTGGTDTAGVNWTLPTFVDGLALYASYTPRNGQETITSEAFGNAELTENGKESVKDERSYALTYAMGPVRVAYGSADIGNTEDTFTGIRYSANGILVAYEAKEDKDAAGAKKDSTSVAASYKMGDVTVKYLQTDTDDNKVDVSAYGINYSLGGGASIIIETGENKAATQKADFTAVGVKFSF